MYFIRVQHLDGNWYKPGRLETWDGKKFIEPSFVTLSGANAVIAEHYSDCLEGSVIAIRLPTPKTRDSVPRFTK